MAIKKLKDMVADLENNTSVVVGTVTKVATTASYAGTAAVAAAGTSGSQL